MSTEQIVIVSVGAAVFAVLTGLSPLLRIRRRVFLTAGAAGIILALLVNAMVARTASLSGLVSSVLAVCAIGALSALLWGIFGQRPARRTGRFLSVHTPREALAQGPEAIATDLLSAHAREYAMLQSGPAGEPAETQAAAAQPEAPAEEPKPEAQTDPQPDAMPDGETAPEAPAWEPQETGDLSIEELEQAFRLEQERIERERVEKLERVRAEHEAAKIQAGEAERLRRKIQEERRKAAPPEAVQQDEEQERLARELADRQAEQTKAAEAEKLWLLEQRRAAEELEARRAQQDREAAANAALTEGLKLLSLGRRVEALPALDRAFGSDASNDVRLKAGVAAAEALAAMGWKADAAKKLRLIKQELQVDAVHRKRLEALAETLFK